MNLKKAMLALGDESIVKLLTGPKERYKRPLEGEARVGADGLECPSSVIIMGPYTNTDNYVSAHPASANTLGS